MAGVSMEALNKQLLDIIRSMEEEENSGPFFFATTLSTFCHDSAETLRDLTQALGQTVIHYKELEELCIKMKGGASSCVTALNTTKQEFLLLQEKMDALVELQNNLFKKWVNKSLLQQVETWAAEYRRQHKDKLQ
ncbi:hypothetical protein COLO4_04302 [Corchorus olitorius]|uniref:Uncharacterized protein n=1 Tax=Corchorus olitorius TaxID=93759 RepID=A0A1R3KUH0_9ROSI|nr:hypothetical protein COLO4_04302 [Corchorus olitorius]